MLRLFACLFIVLSLGEVLSEEKHEAQAVDFSYSLDIFPEEKKYKIEFAEILENLSEEKLIKLKKEKIGSLQALRERVDNFTNSMLRECSSQGFFDAKIDHQIIQKKKRKFLIEMKVSLFNHYKISSVKINMLDPENSDEKDLENKLLQKKFILANINETCSFSNVLNIAQWIEGSMQNRGYPFAEVVRKRILLDAQTQQVKLLYDLKLNQKIHLGSTEIIGLKNLNPEFVKNRVLWNEGMLYDKRLLERTSYMLSGSQIFSNVEIDIDENNIKDGVAPVKIELTEDKSKSIEISASYATAKRYNFFNEGTTARNLKSIRGKVKWTHFNLFSGGERLVLEASGSPLHVKSNNKSHDYEMLASISIPDMIFKGKSTSYYVKYNQVYKSAYYKHGRAIGMFGDIPDFIPYLKIQLGGAIEHNNVTGPFDKEKYKSINAVIRVDYDRRNSVLNPTRGWMLSLQLQPESFSNTHGSMVSTKLLGSYNKSLDRHDESVVACWGRVSKLFTSNNKVPLDRRLYAGGVASVRGYGSQLAGKLVGDKERGNKFPEGGKFALEGGVEWRKKIYREWGGTIFLETANVSNKNKPSGRWYTGLGFGVRYYSVIGPVRVDVAFPTKRRKYVDSKWQVYISLGQAF